MRKQWQNSKSRHQKWHAADVCKCTVNKSLHHPLCIYASTMYLLLHCVFAHMAMIQHHRCGGSGLVRHQRRGGDRAEQAGVWPGLRGHPQAPVLWRRPRPQHLHAAASGPVLGGDPEEAGGCWGTAEGTDGRAFLRVRLQLWPYSWLFYSPFRLYQATDSSSVGEVDLSAEGGGRWKQMKGGERWEEKRGGILGWLKEGNERPEAASQGQAHNGSYSSSKQDGKEREREKGRELSSLLRSSLLLKMNSTSSLVEFWLDNFCSKKRQTQHIIICVSPI